MNFECQYPGFLSQHHVIQSVSKLSNLQQRTDSMFLFPPNKNKDRLLQIGEEWGGGFVFVKSWHYIRYVVLFLGLLPDSPGYSTLVWCEPKYWLSVCVCQNEPKPHLSSPKLVWLYSRGDFTPVSEFVLMRVAICFGLVWQWANFVRVQIPHFLPNSILADSHPPTSSPIIRQIPTRGIRC